MDESWEISGFFGDFFPREGDRWNGLKWGEPNKGLQVTTSLGG